MKKAVFSKLLILALVVLLGAALYLNGDYIVFIITYVFVFAYLAFMVMCTPSALIEKIVECYFLALTLAAQILFAALVMRTSSNQYDIDPYRLIGVLVIAIPFLIRELCFPSRNADCTAPSIEELGSLSYARFIQDQETISRAMKKAGKAGRLIAKSALRDLISELMRHDSFSYISNGNLTDDYFRKASETLDDGYIYIVITKSKSTSSEVIGLFTNRPYNHVSLSFDSRLNTIVSYNGGNKVPFLRG